MKIKKTNLLRKLSIALVVLFCFLLISVELIHRYNYGHFVPYGLHVDALNRDAYIGIPGQTKMYWAEITNYSLLPVKLSGCDYVTDAFGQGTKFPYALQRWNVSSNTWQTIDDVSEEDFCHPVPLSTIETHLVSRWLFPGASIDVMEGEATGARIPFQKGDTARFVVFPRIENGVDWQSAIPSVPFYIQDDVIRNENDSFRIQH